MKTKQQKQRIKMVLQAILSNHRMSVRENKIGKTYNFKKFRLFDKFHTNPYVDYSYSGVQ